MSRRKEGAVGLIRGWIEGFLRGRYGYEGYRALWVLAVPVLIGATLLVAWSLFGSLPTIPRFTTEGPVVRNGVAAVVVCGKKSGAMNEKGMMAVSEHAPEPRTGGWWPARRRDCTVWYHRPPDWHQRVARQERADVAEPRRYDPYVAEPRRVPKPKICSDYANAHEILIDEQAGKLTKDDKLWLDMDGDGRYCEGRDVVWKGERTHAE